MDNNYQYRGIRIYWHNSNGTTPFEDPSYATVHSCFMKPKFLEDGMAKNADDIQILFRVVDSLIDRVSSLEQKI